MINAFCQDVLYLMYCSMSLTTACRQRHTARLMPDIKK